MCSPAPFFCMITQVTMYLNGLFRAVSRFRQCSTVSEHQLLTCVAPRAGGGEGARGQRPARAFAEGEMEKARRHEP